jgi:hypothetical protein
MTGGRDRGGRPVVDWQDRVEAVIARALAVAHRVGPRVVVAAVTVVVAVVFAHVFAGEPCGDDNSFHYAEVARLAEAMRDGDWDWWNPSGNSGFASGYYYQVVAQAVPAAVSAATGLSPLTCFQLGIFVPLVLAPAAAYRAVRIVDGTAWQAAGAAVAVPFAIGASRWGHGADGTFLVGLYTQLWAFVALPLALAHGARWIERGRGLAAALAWGLVVGLCHPLAGVALGVALVAGTIGVVVRWAVRPAFRDRAPGWPAVRLVALGALLVAGAACAWLPVVVDYDGFGGFPHRVSDEVGPGFARLARWIVGGHLLDEERILPLLTVAVPLGLVSGGRWLGWLWAAAIAYAAMLGVGPHLPKVGGDDLLPAVRFYGALQIVLALIAGIGVAAGVERVWRLRLGEPWRPALRSAATTTAAMLAVLVVATGVEVHASRVKVATDFPRIERGQLGEAIAAMRALPPGRLQVRGDTASHWAIMVPYVDAGRPASLVMGGAPLQSSPNYAYLWELRDRDAARAAWVFDAPLVLAPRGDQHAGDVVFATAAYELRQLPAPGLVGPVEIVGALPPGRDAARRETVRWLSSELPWQHQVLAYAGSGEAGPLPRGRVLEVDRGGSWISARVAADAPTTFVIRESWHPRWRATIDGAAARIRRVTPDYLALDVPDGDHALRVQFDRPVWTWILWLVGPGLVAAAAAGERRWRRRAAAAEARGGRRGAARAIPEAR